MPKAHLRFVSAESTIILQGMPPGKILQNYTQTYACLVLSGTTFKVIVV